MSSFVHRRRLIVPTKDWRAWINRCFFCRQFAAGSATELDAEICPITVVGTVVGHLVEGHLPGGAAECVRRPQQTRHVVVQGDACAQGLLQMQQRVGRDKTLCRAGIR